MRRSVIEAPTWHEPAKREAIELELQLITPMFGGGYKTREVDPVMPIRPAAIRGHLRFWWRATAGAQYANAEELYKAETAIWGGAAVKNEASVGKVAIEVVVLNRGELAPYNQVAPHPTPQAGPREGYFLFPFRAQHAENIPAATGIKGVKFRLALFLDSSLSDKQRNQVRNALKAWIAFGGVGARTRRGCGALKVVGSAASQWQLPHDKQQLSAWLRQSVGEAASKTDLCPSLKGAQILVISGFQDAKTAWSELGKFWARFRKGHFGQEYRPISGGKWRDYRQVLCKLPPEKSTIQLAKPYLGLPIIYQRITGARNLCFTGNIEPTKSGRMASPVIIKPVVLSNGQVAGLIAVLNAQQPTQIRIENKTYNLSHPKQDPVIKELGASSVFDAVIKAAQVHFKGKNIIQAGGV
ncbi:MAG: type III-B CRISPR module RAMP protein Cmr1 [Fimbriimonadales bacterium]|nr:MAG: type III-B CRISPR module RAMP protein Cmr1 [Fimbriimonadales bacterium]